MRRMARVGAIVGAVAIAVLGVGCSGAEAPADDATSEEAQTNLHGWTDVSRGISQRKVDGGGSALIVYGGYGARSEHSEAWADELVRARGRDFDWGTVYASKGPRDALYQAREMGNSALAAHLASNPPDAIYVIAHSSGAYVAHELLGYLTPALKARTHYYDLDGGQQGLTTAIATKLAGLTFVYADKPGVGLSRNGSLMKSLVGQYRGAKGFEIDASASGCLTSNCLHDALVTGRPHDPHMFDVADDYVDFEGRTVTAQYF